jgi:hypothetical protein
MTRKLLRYEKMCPSRGGFDAFKKINTIKLKVLISARMPMLPQRPFSRCPTRFSLKPRKAARKALGV